MYKIDPEKLNAAMRDDSLTTDSLFAVTKLPDSEREAFNAAIAGKEEIDPRSLALIAHVLDIMPYEIADQI